MTTQHATQQSSVLARAQSVLSHAVYRLLLPVVRVLMRHGMTYHSFASIAKRAYVVAAQDDLGLPGKSQTKSRIALLTGLTRREVTQLINQDDSDVAADHLRFNRVAWVLGQWVSDPVFCEEDGKPMTLPVKSAEMEQSFHALVKKHGSDMPYGAVLDELINAGFVERTQDDRVRIIKKQYEPLTGSVDVLQYIGMAGHRLLSTIEHNIERSALASEPDVELDEISPAFFQREVWSKAIPPHRVDYVREKMRDLLSDVESDLDAYLESEEELPSAPHHRVAGFGLYYFEVD